MIEPGQLVGNVLGGVGVTLLLVAFVLNAMGRITVGYLYTTLNLVGALLAAVASLLIMFLPFLVLETVWFLAAAAKLASLRREDRVVGAAAAAD